MTSTTDEDSLVAKQTARLPRAIPAFRPSTDLSFNYSQLKNVKPLFADISSGNFSSIKSATINKKQVVIKTLNFEDAVYSYVELSILRHCSSLKHKHILGYFGAAKLDTTVVLISEFMERGDVKKSLRPDLHFFKKNIHASDLDFVWKQRIRVVKHLALALQSLHNLHVVHRDIKCENLFLTGRGRKTVCKLGDFGFARGIDTSDPNRTYTMCGTDELMSPEMLLGMPYSFPADVYSFGLVVVEMIVGRTPTPFPEFKDNLQNHHESFSSNLPGFATDEILLDTTDDDINKDDVDLRNFGGDFLVRNARDSFDIEFEQVRKYALAGCPFSLIELASQCLAYEPQNRLSANDIADWMNALEEDLQSKSAERVPSQLPPKKWVFDKSKGNFTSNGKNIESKRSTGSTLGRNVVKMLKSAVGMSRSDIKTVNDLLAGDDKEKDKKLEAEDIAGVVPVKVVPKTGSNNSRESSATNISKYSQTNIVANVARRQLRHMTRTLSTQSMAAKHQSAFTQSEIGEDDGTKKENKFKELSL